MALEFLPFINSPVLPPTPTGPVNLVWRGGAPFNPALLEQNIAWMSEGVSVVSQQAAPKTVGSFVRMFSSAERYLVHSRFSTFLGGVARFTFWTGLAFTAYEGIKILKNELYDPFVGSCARLKGNIFFIPSLHRLPAGIVPEDPYRGDPNSDAPYFPPAPPRSQDERNEHSDRVYGDWERRKKDPQDEKHWPIKVGVPPRRPILSHIPKNQGPLESD